jgi:acetyl-CoA carboxylase carboxyl transferase subunit alpha
MMENTWYTVISPESCSSILWRSWEFKEQAAAALKLTGADMKRLKLIDGIIQEPVGGAHANREGAFKAVQDQIITAFNELKDLNDADLVTKRMDKYAEMGVYKE